VRVDVVVRGPRADVALGELLALVESDIADLSALPVHSVEGLAIVEPLRQKSGTHSIRAARPVPYAAFTFLLSCTVARMGLLSALHS